MRSVNVRFRKERWEGFAKQPWSKNCEILRSVSSSEKYVKPAFFTPKPQKYNSYWRKREPCITILASRRREAPVRTVMLREICHSSRTKKNASVTKLARIWRSLNKRWPRSRTKRYWSTKESDRSRSSARNWRIPWKSKGEYAWSL